MGTIAARHVCDKVSTLMQIQGILAMAIAQAIDILHLTDPERQFSPAALALHAQVRALSPEITQDRPFSHEIEALARMVSQMNPAG